MRQFLGWVAGGGLVAVAVTSCGSTKRDFRPAGAAGANAGGANSAAGANAGGASSAAGANAGGANSAAGANAGGANSAAGANSMGGDAGDAGAGGDETSQDVCASNQPTCDGDRATTCNSNGTGYLAAGLKCSSTQVCVQGACEDQECTPSASFCSGNSVRKCADNGLSSEAVKVCSNDQYCDVASAACRAGVCSPDKPACDGTRATLCNATGSGYVAGGTVCSSSETCDAGQCKAQVCTPNATFCQGQDVKLCSDKGLSSSVSKTCTNQTCVAAANSAACQGVCAPAQQDCSTNGVRTCDATGQYGTPSKCTNKTCVTSGTTASCTGTCEPAQTQCSANGIQTCGGNGAYGAAVACAAAKPYCYSNTCNAEPPSCTGLTPNCGPGESCCTSPLVTGASFKRDNDANFTATISNVRLDKYEVTVGRFRRFVTAVVGGWTPAAGSGKHTHLNAGAGLKDSGSAGNEAGWNTAWNTYLPAAKGTWDGSDNLGNNPRYQTWTPSSGGNENLPINCVNWFQSAAFCIWDQGFLPSEAEWNYAAAGGTAQRTYPWGATEPAADNHLAVYGCYFNHADGTCADTTNIAPVGTMPAGNGLFGQADLAGNVREWNLDTNASYTVPCVNCAYLQTGNGRVFRGGGWVDNGPDLATSRRGGNDPALPNANFGFRCARTP